MNPIYNARFWTPGQYRETVQDQDYETEILARAAVKEAGEGQVIKFARYQNLPGCLPEVRHSSIWLVSYSNGKWTQVNIHG